MSMNLSYAGIWNHNDSCSSDLLLQTTDTGNGSRGAYGRVMWPWFATGLEGQRNEFYGSAVTLCEMGH